MDFHRLQSISFFVLLGVVGIVFGSMLMPYAFPIFWAAVVATLFYPLYNRLHRVMIRPNLSASITVIVVLIVVVLPVATGISIIVQQALVVFGKLSRPETLNAIQTALQNLSNYPGLKEIFGQATLRERLISSSASIGSVSLDILRVGSQNTAIFLINVLVMLYALFFFLRDGEMWLQKAMHYLPLRADRERALYQQFAMVSKATLKGTLILGLAQGVIGVIFFALAGVPQASFWGIVMALFSVIPPIGTAIVWAPAMIYYFVTGNVFAGVILLIGGVIMTLADNTLRPILVGKGAQLHPLLTFLATIGGLVSFGPTGFILGPLIAAFFLSLMQIYEQEYHEQLKEQ